MKIAFHILRTFCPPQLVEEIEGDLIQKFERDVKRFSQASDTLEVSDAYALKKAKRRLLWNTIRFLRPGIVLRNTLSIKTNHLDMLSHYLKMFFRTSSKRRSYSLITISGLVIGITSFSLISLYVWQEKSYDQFHSNKDRIFRIQEDDFAHGSLEEQFVGVGAAVGQDIKDNFPEVHRYVRLRKNQVMLSNGDRMFKEDRVFFASEDFFMMFSFPLVKGVDSLVLKEPFTMAVSESFAKKYFGQEDPIGKFLKNNGSEEYQITGVFKDVPENTHLQVDALFSFNSLYSIFGPKGIEYLTKWGWVGYPTYLELHSSADPQLFASKLPSFIEKKMGSELKALDGALTFNLQPLTSIHLNSNFNHEISTNGNGRTVDFLSLVAILILVMAWFNYINMATARSLERAKEVGIRKVLGCNRVKLIQQFLLESFIFNVIALVLSFSIILLALSYFEELVDRRFDLYALATLDAFLFLSGLLFFGVVSSGLYPALAISGFKPASILKGKFQSSSFGARLRTVMVLSQFVASIVLIVGAGVIYNQLHFMQNSPLGVNVEQVLVVNGPTVQDSTYAQKFNLFRNDLLNYPDILEVTASSVVPGRGSRNGSGGVRLASQSERKGNGCDVAYVDEDFLRTFDLELAGGRNFSLDFMDNGKSVMLNETALRMLEFNEPEKIIGEQILVYGDTLKIVGVIKDYHHQSLKEKVEPLIFICDHGASTFYSIKIRSKKSMTEVLNRTEITYKESFAGNPFNNFFLDDYFNEQYKSDIQFGKVFNLFTAAAIFIACLGLLGLSSYSVAQRTKEIGIRKILGASVQQICILVSKNFIGVVLLANAISIPIAYLLTDNWLNGFANRISLGVVIFMAPSVCTLLIAILTVASQSINAAHTDPVKNLRTE